MTKPPPTPEERRRLRNLLLGTAALIVAGLVVTAIITATYGKWRGFVHFLNGDHGLSFKTFILSMLAGVAFGIMDNAQLFLSVDAIAPFLPAGVITAAGWSNAYSDVMGTFFVSYIDRILLVVFSFHNGPIYGQAIGVFIGCMVGLYVPRWITGKM
jgi:hypothetical protein